MAHLGMTKFVELLPPQVRTAVGLFMHKKTFRTHPFFSRLGNKRILSEIGQRFCPMFYNSGSYLYRQGDDINTFKVVTKGIGAFVMPLYEN
jgi:hypothetical protein